MLLPDMVLDVTGNIKLIIFATLLTYLFTYLLNY